MLNRKLFSIFYEYNMKIAIVGCGNMGMAFARSFIQYNLVKKEELLLIEKSKERSETLKASKRELW